MISWLRAPSRCLRQAERRRARSDEPRTVGGRGSGSSGGSVPRARATSAPVAGLAALELSSQIALQRLGAVDQLRHARRSRSAPSSGSAREGVEVAPRPPRRPRAAPFELRPLEVAGNGPAARRSTARRSAVGWPDQAVEELAEGLVASRHRSLRSSRRSRQRPDRRQLRGPALAGLGQPQQAPRAARASARGRRSRSGQGPAEILEERRRETLAPASIERR